MHEFDVNQFVSTVAGGAVVWASIRADVQYLKMMVRNLLARVAALESKKAAE